MAKIVGESVGWSFCWRVWQCLLQANGVGGFEDRQEKEKGPVLRSVEQLGRIWALGCRPHICLYGM